MSAGEALVAAAVAAVDALDGAAIEGLGRLSAVFDAAPARAAPPYAVVGDPVLIDWSGAGVTGREGRLTVTLWDAGEVPARLRALLEAAEAAVLAMGPELGGGWRVASLLLVRSRVARAGGDRWTGVSEFRVRMYRAQ